MEVTFSVLALGKCPLGAWLNCFLMVCNCFLFYELSLRVFLSCNVPLSYVEMELGLCVSVLAHPHTLTPSHHTSHITPSHPHN